MRAPLSSAGKYEALSDVNTREIPKVQHWLLVPDPLKNLFQLVSNFTTGEVRSPCSSRIMFARATKIIVKGIVLKHSCYQLVLLWCIFCLQKLTRFTKVRAPSEATKTVWNDTILIDSLYIQPTESSSKLIERLEVRIGITWKVPKISTEWILRWIIARWPRPNWCHGIFCALGRRFYSVPR